MYIKPGDVVGVGTGTTVSYFIDALGSMKNKIQGAVSSSLSSSVRLRSLGIPLFDLNEIDSLDIYIDSADEVNNKMQMIKGGGAALTNEKIIASFAKKFICIIDSSKLVNILGSFPLPVEVVPIARSGVKKELVRLGGIPIDRKGIITDNGNVIIDTHNLYIFNALFLEEKINNIPGVVTVGLFAHRSADIVLISSEWGVKIIS